MTYIVFIRCLHCISVMCLAAVNTAAVTLGCTSGGTELLPFAVAFNEETTVSLDTVFSIGPTNQRCCSLVPGSSYASSATLLPD